MKVETPKKLQIPNRTNLGPPIDLPANEVSESKEECDDSATTTVENHRDVAQEQGEQEEEVGGEAEGEVREASAGHGGV